MNESNDIQTDWRRQVDEESQKVFNALLDLILNAVKDCEEDQ